MEEIRKYQPSNGTEGCAFTSRFCDRCRHEKYSHTQNDADAKCDIYSRTMYLDTKDEDYPVEWTYDEKGVPTCTAYEHHEWIGEDGELIEPEEIEEVDPNQLSLGF